jgi:hypothetical protein
VIARRSVCVMRSLALVGLAYLCLGSGCAANSRESAIRATLVGVEASDKAFIAYDQAQQADIVAKATSLEDGKAKLAAYRVRQATVQKLFVAAYTAIGVAARLEDDHSVTAMRDALAAVVDAVAALTGGKP